MATFDLSNPFTFRPSATDFAAAYSYQLSVTPDDPTKYHGPDYVTVSSSRLLTENEILALASDMVLSRDRYQYGGTPIDLTIIDAVINRALIPEG